MLVTLDTPSRLVFKTLDVMFDPSSAISSLSTTSRISILDISQHCRGNKMAISRGKFKLEQREVEVLQALFRHMTNFHYQLQQYIGRGSSSPMMQAPLKPVNLK